VFNPETDPALIRVTSSERKTSLVELGEEAIAKEKAEAAKAMEQVETADAA
jgi:hypothetical protein